MKFPCSIPPLIAYGLIANFVAAAIPLTLLEISDGEAIRPMGHAVMIPLWAFVSACILIPKSLLFMVHSKRLIAGVVGIVLAIAPLPVSIVVFRWVVEFKSFILKD